MPASRIDQPGDHIWPGADQHDAQGNDVEPQRLPEPDRALVGANHEVELHGAVTALAGMVEGMQAHLARKVTGGKVRVTGDAFEVVRARDVDIVIELIGGYTVAKDLVMEAIRNGTARTIFSIAALSSPITVRLPSCSAEP